MTAQSVRDIGYISWKDPFAWMESMKGKHWNNLLLHEKHNYNTLAKQVHRETRHMEKEITGKKLPSEDKEKLLKKIETINKHAHQHFIPVGEETDYFLFVNALQLLRNKIERN